MFDCKLICVDIDGTLQDSTHHVTDRTRRAIQKAAESGIVVTLASGRIASSLRLIQRHLGIAGPLCCFSGALVLDGSAVLSSHPIDPFVCRPVTEAARKAGLEVFIFTQDHWYIDSPTVWFDRETAISGVRGNIEPFSSLLFRLEHKDILPYKILCMAEDENRTARFERNLDRRFGSMLHIYRSSPKYVEISAKGIDKGDAVRLLCRQYGIEASRTMAIGDFSNDIGMFEAAGYAVAMGNAPKAVKRKADAVTRTNDEDGVAYAIEGLV